MAALVNVAAVVTGVVHLVARVAVAPVCAHEVLTSAVLADVWVLSALIDICMPNRRVLVMVTFVAGESNRVFFK